MSGIQPQDRASHRYANRGVAVAFSWMGGFCSIMPVYIWSVIWGNQQDIALIGGRVSALIVGSVLAAVAATIVCLGCAIAIMLHRRVKRKHAKRLNTATFAGSVCSLWAAVGLWKVSSFPDTFLILGFMMLMCATLFEMLLLHELRHRGIIASPADGACPYCDYPIGASPVCTECGAALPRNIKTSKHPNVERI